MPETHEAAIRLNYFRRIPNVGDALSPHVVADVSGRATRWHADDGREHLLAIGSILSAAGPTSVVWGSGIMFPQRVPAALRPQNVFALRGKLTHAALKDAGLAVPDVPLGDPGYLIPQDLVTDEPPPERSRLGFVPHFVDRSHPLFRRLVVEDGVLDVNVHAEPREFLRAMRSCDCIVSSSLHGLVLAESLGIPNLWIGLSERILATEFKYRDWFSLADEPQRAPYLPTGRETAADLAGRACLHGIRIDAEALRRSFPAQRIEALSEPVERTSFVSLATCRRRRLPVFVICRNSGRRPERVIEACERFTTNVDIIVLDDGSDDPETLRVLQGLGESGRRVVPVPRDGAGSDVERVGRVVDRYFADWAEPPRYVITDCDVDPSTMDPGSLDLYDEVLNLVSKACCVGPAVDADASRAGAEAGDAGTREAWEVVETSHGGVATCECAVTTRFALYRPGRDYLTWRTSRRVAGPYAARRFSAGRG